MCLIVVVQMGLIGICNSGTWTHVEKRIWVACGTYLGHYGQHITVIWSSMPENLSSEGCEHQRRRAACTSALSDQHLCCSLFVKYHS